MFQILICFLACNSEQFDIITIHISLWMNSLLISKKSNVLNFFDPKVFNFYGSSFMFKRVDEDF